MLGQGLRRAVRKIHVVFPAQSFPQSVDRRLRGYISNAPLTNLTADTEDHGLVVAQCLHKDRTKQNLSCCGALYC